MIPATHTMLLHVYLVTFEPSRRLLHLVIPAPHRHAGEHDAPMNKLVSDILQREVTNMVKTTDVERDYWRVVGHAVVEDWDKVDHAYRDLLREFTRS